MNRRLTATLLAAVLLALAVWPGRTEALPLGPALSYETPFAGGLTLTGTAAAQQTFLVMDYWDVQGATASLSFQVSQLAEESLTSVTLSVNGRPFHSFRPAPGEGPQSLNVPVPAELIQSGANSLTIQGSVRREATGNYCAIDRLPEDWLRLDEASSVTVAYERLPRSGGIADFAERFSGIDYVRDGLSLLAVPDASEGSEMEAAVYALTGFAKGNELTERNIPLLPYRAEKLNGREAVAVVGLYDRLPERLKALLDTESGLDQAAIIQVVEADGVPTLVVTSRDESLLIKAGRLMASPGLVSQLGGPLKVVDDFTEIDTPPLVVNETVNLTESGTRLTGPYHQEESYYIPLPANRSLGDAAALSFDFRYAANLDFNRSLFTVSVNGVPVGSKKLTAELAGGDSLRVTLPRSLQVTGNFSVTAAFELELPGQICSPNEDHMPWAYIEPTSAMKLTTKDGAEMLFNDYPYPFLRDGQYNRIAVVLPQAMDDYVYLSVSNLFNLLGKYAAGNTGDVRFYTDSAGEAYLKDSNIIAVGSYGNNRLIRDSNESLYFKYNADGGAFVSNEKMSLDAAYGGKLGSLQLMDSPFGGGRGMLAVTGATSSEVYLASQLLATEQSRYKVFGDGVVTDRDGNVAAYRFKLDTGAEDGSLLDNVAARPEMLGFTAAAVLTLAFVLVSLLLLLRKHGRKRGDRR